MHEFKHPKYYKELRKRNKSDQAISESKTVDIGDSVRPGPGLKQRRLTKKEERIGWITRGHDE
jgi:ribosomal protein S17